MGKREGFPTNSNFPVKKNVCGGNQNNIFGLTPQGKARVLVANSSEVINPKSADTVIGTDNERSQSKSLSFPESFSIPKSQTDPKENETYVTDDQSEKEVSMNRMQPAFRSKSFYTFAKSSTTVNRFFNNIPSLDSRMAIQHSDIRQFKTEDVRKAKPPISMIRESFGDENDSMSSINNDRAARARDESPSQPPRSIHTKSSKVVSSSNNSHTIKAKVSTTPRRGKKNVTNINIKFDLKISIRDGSDSDSTSSSSSAKSSPRKLTETTINTRTNKHAGTPNLMLPMLKDSEEPKTPQKPEAVIDENLQKMLNAVYGEAWKTPDLLRSCKSKRVRENLRKSLHANNFESFVPDLESMRVSDKEEFRKPVAPVSAKKTASVKKQKRTKSSTESESDEYLTPKSQKSQTISKPTPKYLEICDPDTSSSDESEETSSSSSKTRK